jgi:hypothetical protein
MFKIFIKLIFLSLLIFSILNAQVKDWKGSKVIKDDVIYINNPEKPVYYKNKLPFPKLTKIMSIGVEDGDERYILGNIFGIAFDREENIYLLDNPYHCIKVYDKNGKYLKQIGKKGQGPGEFDKPFRISITTEDKIVVFDMGNRRICVLNKQGDFEHSVVRPFLATLLILNTRDEIILVRPVGDIVFKMNQGKYNPFLHLDLNGNEVRSYGKAHYIEKGGYSSPSFSYAKALPNGDLLTVFENIYRILEYDPLGNIVREIKKEDQFISEHAVIQNEKSNRKIVYTRAIIRALFVLPDGSFLTQIVDYGNNWKYKRALPFGSDVEGIVRRFDYFNKDGQFLASFSWDYENYGGLYHIDKNGFAYTRKDAFGIPKLTKYKIDLNLK